MLQAALVAAKGALGYARVHEQYACIKPNSREAAQSNSIKGAEADAAAYLTFPSVCLSSSSKFVMSWPLISTALPFTGVMRT